MATVNLFKANSNKILEENFITINNKDYLQVKVDDSTNKTSTTYTCSLKQDYAPGYGGRVFSNGYMTSNDGRLGVCLDLSDDFRSYMSRLQTAMKNSNVGASFYVRVNGTSIPLNSNGHNELDLTERYDWNIDGCGSAIMFRNLENLSELENGVTIQYGLSGTSLDFYYGHSGELSFQSQHLSVTRDTRPNEMSSIEGITVNGSGRITVSTSKGGTISRDIYEKLYITNYIGPQYISNSNWVIEVDGERIGTSNDYGTVNSLSITGTFFSTNNSSVSIRDN